jgi:hypothetical protein
LAPNFFAQLDRRPYISARRAEIHDQFVDIGTDRSNQLDGFVRHSRVDHAMDLHAADVRATVQVVNVGSAPGALLFDG